jgi:GYF domain 2
MSDRSWFYAANGQQQGPYPEAQLRDLIARGTVRADTLVWSEGMAGWQKAGEIPGLMSAAARPPAMPPAGVPPMAGSGGYGGGVVEGPLSIDFGILEFTWRTLVAVIGMAVVIPAPWVLVWYLKWLVPCVSVPGRPNMSFEGSAMTIVPWFFGAILVAIVISYLDIQVLNLVETIIQFALSWLFVRWFIANLASNGQPLGLSFSGSIWTFVGWNILLVLSIFTIIGWAWVYVAQMRWYCRNIQGTRRAVTFNGTGLEFLWRAIVSLIGVAFVIPIPWVYRWFGQWVASQTVLVERA